MNNSRRKSLMTTMISVVMRNKVLPWKYPMRFQNDLGAWDAQTRSENQGVGAV